MALRDVYLFPAIAEPPAFYGQLLKLRGEAYEVMKASAEGEGGERIAEELMDTIHAAETALRMLEAEGVDLGEVRRMVISKNAARGYYGGKA